MSESEQATSVDVLNACIVERDARIVALQAEIQELREERDRLQQSRQELMEAMALLERRMFIAKAERVDTSQLELEFAQLQERLNNLTPELERKEREPKKKSSPKGRRDLNQANLPQEIVPVLDPDLENLVVEGKAEVIGHQDSYRLAFKRGGFFCVVVQRAKYRLTNTEGDSTLITAEAPKEALTRTMAASSLIANILHSKFGEGMPLFRLEDRFERDAVSLDRGTMSRWVEEAGATLGATIIEAAYHEAKATASIVATDATGILVLPVPTHEKKSQPCKRGHYFAQLFDRDHIFFQYTERETSEAVKVMFKGFEGTVLADAKSVYDVLFRADDETQEPACVEAGCWAHARRGFWEAALGQEPIARQALLRIGRLFAYDAKLRGKPPSEIKRLRQALKPEVEDFFAFVQTEFDKVKDRRGKLRSALGYIVNQKEALMRFTDDGRLPMDNNSSERALRRIAVGRKNWLFVGSDDHASAAGHVLSLIASARLHELDPEAYLRDVLRVLGYWPRERYIELAPKYWARTKERIDPVELAHEVGPITVPSSL